MAECYGGLRNSMSSITDGSPSVQSNTLHSKNHPATISVANISKLELSKFHIVKSCTYSIIFTLRIYIQYTWALSRGEVIAFVSLLPKPIRSIQSQSVSQHKLLHRLNIATESKPSFVRYELPNQHYLSPILQNVNPSSVVR